MPIFGAFMGFSLLFGTTAFPVGNMVLSRHVAPPVPVAPIIPSYTVALTAYNAVPEQTDDTPFETASGAYSNPEIVAARSVDMADKLPFGTIIEIDGSNISPTDTDCGYAVVARHIGYRIIEDSMNPRLTERIDILFGTEVSHTNKNGKVRNAANVLGICKGVTVRVVGRVDRNHIPKTQAELTAFVKGISNTLALR
ncbi:MAG: hypothetical protein AAB951_01600 [Patescibacteria group bacterium]